ncbi:hypothetical protein [Cellulophaga fucicola]|uniref:Entericidin EcnA/B family protein n=1 Tax=Cellulophaga fucicola TaxID=76595 RepID=A0A1K1PP22_9FLAO|nr:hypothetical protein [Cellulophaga fucicola]SFW49211.1 hypothetical protein SAMN05660313_02060 [Cellulophaga fucicola]
MKKILYLGLYIFAMGVALTSCRDTRTTGEKVEDGIEEVGDGIEEGVEEVGDEIDDATDDNE